MIYLDISSFVLIHMYVLGIVEPMVNKYASLFDQYLNTFDFKW
jgi:hypothetical protein